MYSFFVQFDLYSHERKQKKKKIQNDTNMQIQSEVYRIRPAAGLGVKGDVKILKGLGKECSSCTHINRCTSN